MSEKEAAPAQGDIKVHLPCTKHPMAAANTTLVAQIIALAKAADPEHPLIKHFGLSGEGYIQIDKMVLVPLPSSSGLPATYLQIYSNGNLRLVGGEYVAWKKKA